MSENDPLAEPEATTAYEIGGDGLPTGRTLSIEPGFGLPPGWTRAMPPATLPPGKVALWRGGWVAGDPPPSPPGPDMPTLRRAAFDAAMAAANRMTSAVTGSYSDAEARTWAIQEQEARVVAAGGTLPAYALIPVLAADKGETTAVYAARVIQRADSFKAIVAGGVRLRRAAEGLLSPSIDTPAALGAAVAALHQAAAQEAQALGLSLPQ